MGDTQRSQTISTQNRKTVKQSAQKAGTTAEHPGGVEAAPILVGESSLARIRMLAEHNPDLVFTSLAHRIDLYMLRKSFHAVRKSKASGVDKMTATEYAINLDENLYNLYLRLRRGQYAAQPVKRIWIDKEDGKKRPIGIPALEDKIVQKAVSMIFEAIYEVDFYDFSHGFRKGHSQHQALREVQEQCTKQRINWIVNADISGLFDNIDHGHLLSIIKQRVNDGNILRLVGKWLNAGVMEEGKLIHPESGTPQGGVISPVLSNIFLHHVLDDWFVKTVSPRMRRRCFIIRWADDFIIGCELESDAKRILEVLAKRLERFGLTLNRDKTRLVPFVKPSAKMKKDSNTFDFLGFTFYMGKSRQGYWRIKKKTARKRQCRFMKGLWEWCKRNRHEPLKEQYQMLCAKLRGYNQYFGVRCNFKSIKSVYFYAWRAWRYWLGKRSGKGRLTWEKFELMRRKFPLPKPRIVHAF